MLIKLAAVVAARRAGAGVMLFEIMLNATAMFSHSQHPPARPRSTGCVRHLLVTPDMHRVHHSIVRARDDSNFGFNLAIWDRLFGTYRAQPAAGHEAMTIGLAAFRDPRELAPRPDAVATAKTGLKRGTTWLTTRPTRNRGRRLSSLALVLAVGGLAAALLASAGSGAEAWTFRTGFVILRYAFYAAVAGGRAVDRRLVRRAARRVAHPAHEPGRACSSPRRSSPISACISSPRTACPRSTTSTTDLADPPQFVTLAVRADNLDNIPDNGRAELAALDPEKPVEGAPPRRPMATCAALRLAAQPRRRVRSAPRRWSRKRGWDVASANPRTGTIEATDTSLFFRFKDDVVIRVRPDPARAGGSIVDLRSISRVGGSDIGVNAKRIRAFLADLAA